MDRPRRPGLRRLAVITALAFGCATTRVPVSAFGEPEPIDRGAIATPQLELWVEGGEAVTTAEQQQALDAARAALESALAGRGAEGDEGLVLYVRERAVARTDARRNQQGLAVAGIVVGAVVIAAVVVLAIVGGHGGGGAGSLPKAVPHVPAPKSVPAAFPAPVPRPGSVRLPAGGRPPGHGVPTVAVGAPDVDVWVTAAADAGAAQPDAPAAAGGWETSADPWADPPASWDGAVPAAAQLIVPDLPPPSALDVASRGFFAGDEVVFDLVVVERATGQPVWTKTIRRSIDPRDARDVGKTIDEALHGIPWASRR